MILIEKELCHMESGRSGFSPIFAAEFQSGIREVI